MGVLGLLAQRLYQRAGATWGFRILGRPVAPGALLLVTCGFFAGLGFPLDDIWHLMFGQDVTLWGPTHMLMVSGAALSPLGFAMLLSHGMRERGEVPSTPLRFLAMAVASTMLVGISAYQAEFDFGVPQFQMLWQPLLVAAAAGLVLMAVRFAAGRGAALVTVLLYVFERLAIDGGLAGLGRGVARFPMYLGMALVVEAAGLVFRGRPAAMVIAGGLGIGTLGLLAEAGVLEVWGKHPWSGHALELGIGLGLIVALGAATVALAIAAGLRPRLTAPSAWLIAVAAVAGLAPMAVAFPRVVGPAPTVTVRLAPEAAVDAASPIHVGEVHPTVRIDPPTAARGTDWFEVMSWQGGAQVIAPLRETAPGQYVADRAVPVGGTWKTLIRLAKGSQIVATPLYFPSDPTVQKPPVAPQPVMTRTMQLDSKLLLREAHGAPAWASPVGYAVVLAVGIVWLIVVVVTLARLRGYRGRPGVRPERVPGTERRAAA